MKCVHCGQVVIQAHKEVLNKMKLTMLQTAAQHVKETMRNDFKVYEFAPEDQFKTYHNFQKLRYHGLITPVQENAQRIRGRWLITRNGWAFLRGEVDLPKSVKVRNNKVVERDSKLINVRDVYRGSDVIATTFEYFEDGEPIGYRPVRRNNQLSLV